MTYSPANTVVPFVDESIFLPPDFNQLLLKLTDSLRDYATAINAREIALYDLQERITGSLLYNPDNPQRFRPVFRKVIDFGALPNTTSTSVPHGIDVTGDFQFLKIYGAADDPTGNVHIPIPYSSSTLANNIALQVTATDVVIITGSNRSNFTRCSVTLEYVKT